MNLGLQNKVIIISGGAKGIGAAISRGLLEEGAIPVIVDPDEEAGNEVLAGHKGLVIPIKLIKPEDSQRAINQTLDQFSEIHGLVNNAGINDGVGLEKGNPALFAQSLEKNLLHCYHLAHFVLPWLKKSKGSILNISSKTAVTGQGGTSGYTAAKGGLLALTRDWAVELLPYSIRVNAILPAEVQTPLYEAWLSTFDDPEAKLKEVTSRIPFQNRLTRPEEIATMALFLLSKKAGHITGQHIFVDGGYTHLDRSL